MSAQARIDPTTLHRAEALDLLQEAHTLSNIRSNGPSVTFMPFIAWSVLVNHAELEPEVRRIYRQIVNRLYGGGL